jgi:uncharacterized membrane protein YhiD involved in acid resistance
MDFRWVAAGFGFAVVIALITVRWPGILTSPTVALDFPFLGLDQQQLPRIHPLVELLKLVVATGIGLMITAVHKQTRRKEPSRSMEQAQILLCVSGALMMIIINGSVAHALGIAGGAAIIRFRTPVNDAKEAAILFLLLGLGMAAGLGYFAVAGLGALFLALIIWVLDHVAEPGPRTMMLELEGDHPLPVEEIREVFLREGVLSETREMMQSQHPSIRYQVVLTPASSLDELSTALLSIGGIHGVTWQSPKRKTDAPPD